MRRGWIVLLTVVTLVAVAFLPYRTIILRISLVLPEALINFLLAIPDFLWLIILVPITAFLLAYFVLAPNNCFFTFVHEGTVKFVVKGDAFQKCLIQWKGHTFDDGWNIVEGEERHLLGGFRYYGLWPILDIYIYEFRWMGVTEEGKEQVKREWIDFMIVRDDVYLCKIPDAEDLDKLHLDFQVFLTIRITNPYKAKYAVQRWLETILNRIQPLLRQYIAQYRYEDLLKMKHEMGGKMGKELEKAGLLGEKGEFYKRYGVDVRAVEVRQINPPEDYRKETLKKFVAEREKEATVVRAEAEVERLARIYSKIQEFGDLGKLIRTLEAAEKSPLAASLTIQAIPGLPEILRGVFGRSIEAVTSQEFRELREMIERLLKEKE